MEVKEINAAVKINDLPKKIMYNKKKTKTETNAKKK